jgi:CHAT domain-containing protein
MEATARSRRQSRTGKRYLLKKRGLSWCAAGVLSLLAGVACQRQTEPAALFSSAARYFQQGDYKLAQEQAARGYRDFQTKPRSEWHWKFMLLLAEVDLWRGETTQADALLAQEPPPQFQHSAIRYRILHSYVFFRARKTEAAERELNAAAAEAHAIGAWDLEADAENLLGSRVTTSDPNQALHNALQIAAEHRLPYQETAADLNLGLSLYKRDFYGDAIPYFERAAALAKRMDFKEARTMAAQNAADCYREMGDVDRALQIHLEVVRAEEERNIPTTLTNAYIDLGISYLVKQDAARGIEFLHRALRTAQAGKMPTQFVSSANTLAQALKSAGHLDEAERYNREAFQVCDKRSTKQLAELYLIKASIAAERGHREEAAAGFQQAVELCGGTPSVLWEAHAGLASVYANSGGIDAARSHFEQALRIIEQNRADQLKRDYEISFLSTLIRFYQAYVSVLMAHGQVADAIEVADSSRANVLTRSLVPTGASRSGRLVENIQRQAKVTNSVFLFYWLAPARSYLWVITARALQTIALPDERSIAQDVASYLAVVVDEKRDPLLDSNPVAKRLYQTLIEPAAAWLPRGARVVVVPDGPLHNLNFEMLVSGKPEPHYWIQDALIFIAPSLGILQRLAHSPAASQRALLVGDPLPAPGYPALPHAAVELSNVQRRFPGRTAVYQGAAATVDSYRAAEPGNFSTIHFAAHAEANPLSPLDSAIILSPQGDRYKLYARDLADIPITADLVTISACQGAGARAYSGEGLVGFAWAFFQAGARNVVAGLWDVNDATTAEIMNSFYERVAAGEPYADALREAKLRMLETAARKPYYWAPFQLYTRMIVPAGRALAVTAPSRAVARRSPQSASR